MEVSITRRDILSSDIGYFEFVRTEISPICSFTLSECSPGRIAVNFLPTNPDLWPAKFVVTSPQILDERVTTDHNTGRLLSFQPAHRAQPGL